MLKIHNTYQIIGKNLQLCEKSTTFQNSRRFEATVNSEPTKQNETPIIEFTTGIHVFLT